MLFIFAFLEWEMAPEVARYDYDWLNLGFIYPKLLALVDN